MSRKCRDVRIQLALQTGLTSKVAWLSNKVAQKKAVTLFFSH